MAFILCLLFFFLGYKMRISLRLTCVLKVCKYTHATFLPPLCLDIFNLPILEMYNS